MRIPKPVEAELEALEFPDLRQFIGRGARTNAGRAAIDAMHPFDGLAGVRRLRQMELEPLWRQRPQDLPISNLDAAFQELLNPAGWLLPEHWRSFRDGLPGVALLLRSVAGLGWPEHFIAPEGTHPGIDCLHITAAILPDPTSIAERFRRIFTEDGVLDALKVPGLSELHSQRQRAFQSVQAKLNRLLREHAEAFQEASIVERNGRFCLPVRTDRRGQVEGLVLDRSSTGATLFLEPLSVVALNNDFVEADSSYTQAVQAFLRGLLDELRERSEDFFRWRKFQGEVDEILALLRWQSLCEGSLPELNANRLHLALARHPLLLAKVRDSMELEPLDHEVVPLSLDLHEDCPGLVISGSNTGGKTVVLKTVGLLACLGHSGCAIPAGSGSALPPLPTLHADIGDHQSLLGSLSTFSSHIIHVKNILQHAKPGGLVLLDELGTGTDPKEGAALGIAILRALSRRGAWVLCSTHLGDISQWALSSSRFQNASVQFDEEKLAPTYHLMVGLPGQSRALSIAKRLGLPPQVLDHANQVLGRREKDWREFLHKLEADRLRVMQLEAELRMGQQLLEKDRHILQQREERLRELNEKAQREGTEKVERVLDFLDHEGKRLVKELKSKSKLAENADRLGAEANDRVKLLSKIATSELKQKAQKQNSPKDLPSLKLEGFARHRGLGLEGRIIAMKGDRVTLEVAPGKRFEARAGELDALHRKDLDPPKTKEGHVRVHVDSNNAWEELNLIGRASDDVDTEIHRFVESAIAGGRLHIRIVHGHGTGKLKSAVRLALQGHPGIKGIEDAPLSQGGAGATLVTLR
ncbi:MAG: Smr/MutS family protein [Holophagaceae bacterium]|nr:Smr/MutS family protein [Holophagaceae bacterium]